MSCHSILASKVSVEKSADSLMVVPLYITSCFFLDAFKIPFLSLIFFIFNDNESVCGPIWVDLVWDSVVKAMVGP